jgi:hypothetical protein
VVNGSDPELEQRFRQGKLSLAAGAQRATLSRMTDVVRLMVWRCALAVTMVLCLALCGLVVSTGARLAADDIDVNDLRVSVGELPTHYKDASPQAANANGPVNFAQAQRAAENRRAELSYRHIAFGDGGGLILGIEVGADKLVFNDSDHSTDYSILQADALVGYALRLGAGWHVEAEAIGGTGRLSAHGLSQRQIRSGDAYFEYGGQLGAFYTMHDGLQFGLELPYLITKVDPTYAYVQANGSVTTVTEYRRSVGGFSWLASIGIRF